MKTYQDFVLKSVVLKSVIEKYYESKDNFKKNDKASSKIKNRCRMM